MKKLTVFAVLFCVAAVFAAASDFTVQSVTGSVVRESGNQRIAIAAGETLDGTAIIHTGEGTVVLRDIRGRDITLAAGQNGTIAELARAASGIRITGSVSRTDTGAVTRAVGQAGTASARASDAAGDDDIAAE